jgi:hypothetical protein
MYFTIFINKIVTVLKVCIIINLFKKFNVNIVDLFNLFRNMIKNMAKEIYSDFYSIYKKEPEVKTQKNTKKTENNENIVENRLNHIIMSSKTIVAHNGRIYTSCINYPYINNDKIVGMVFDLNTKLWIGNWSYKENYKGEHINEKYIKSFSKDFDNEIYVDRYLNIVFDTFVKECVVEDSKGYVSDDDIEDAFVKWFLMQRIDGYNPSFSEVFYYFTNRYGVSFSKTIIPGIKLNTTAISENEQKMLDEYDPEEDYELWGLWY